MIRSRNNLSKLYLNNIKSIPQNLFLIKIDEQGRILWTKETTLKNSYMLSLSSTIDGGACLVGKTNNGDTPKMVKFSADGQIEYIRELPFKGALLHGIGRSNGDIFTLGYFNIGLGNNSAMNLPFIANLNSEGLIP